MPASTLLAFVAFASLPPALADRLNAARDNNPAIAISRAQVAAQEAAADQSAILFVPRVQADGRYVRNQYDSSLSYPTSFGPGGPTLQTITIQPYDQFSGSVGVALPLVDLSAAARQDEARHGSQIAQEAARSAEDQVLLATAHAYFDVVAAQGIAEAASRSVAVAEAGLKIARIRKAAGATTQLTVDRAELAVHRALQDFARADLTLRLAIRNLETLSARPLESALPVPDDLVPPDAAESDLVAEALDRRPEIAEARAAAAQQEKALDASRSQWYPTLSANAQELVANNAGFQANNAYWTAGLTLGWSFAPTTVAAAARRDEALLRRQRARIDQAVASVKDEVHAALLGIRAGRAQVDQARAAHRTAQSALRMATEQFKAGTATALELSEAQSDAFRAEADVWKSRAELSKAVLSLQKAVGYPLVGEP